MPHRIALFLVLLAPLSAQPDRFGLPACSGPDRELAVKHAFILCHSATFKTPLWTIHELPPSSLAAHTARRMHFRRDRSLSMPGAADADYRNSGFSRGHLVPARDFAGDEHAFSDSFLLSNAVPQNSSMNSSLWRRLENRLRKLVEEVDSVIVVTGAIFSESPERIGQGGVAVPAELYKVILVSKRGLSSVTAVLMPNADTGDRSLESFLTTVAEVEKRAALKFFPDVDRNRQMPIGGSSSRLHPSQIF